MTTLNSRELDIIQDTEFLLTKAKALAKIENMLAGVRGDIRKILDKHDLPFTDMVLFKSAKISRGENYQGLPYQVLDYPALFQKENIFAYRTMFWWGNFFSATLHLEGESLKHYRAVLMDRLPLLVDQEIYVCIAESPWHYHYGLDNYQLLTKDHTDHISNASFLKLSKKLDLDQWEELSGFSTGFLEQLIKILTLP